MTEIYLIRHAQAEGNLYRMMQGQWDGGVTELGRRQIAALAERFKDIKIDAVYSSDLFRARLTGEALRKYNDVPMILDKRLREINVGPWEAGFFGDAAHENPEQMYYFQNDPEKWYIEGAETYADVENRAIEALYDIARSNEGKSIGITSHGVTIRCMLKKLTDGSYTGEDNIPIFGNTAITRIIYENGEFTIDWMNDYTHLVNVSTSKWRWSGTVRTESFDPRTDRAYYNACYADAWKAAHGSTVGYQPGPYYASAVEHYIQNKNAVHRVFVDDAEAGLIDLDPCRGEKDGIGWISLLYLREEFRNQGFGIQLLGRAYFLYENLGRDRVRLHVAEENTAAVKFYKKWGFETIAVDSGTRGALLLMEKKLGTDRL